MNKDINVDKILIIHTPIQNSFTFRYFDNNKYDNNNH